MRPFFSFLVSASDPSTSCLVSQIVYCELLLILSYLLLNRHAVTVRKRHGSDRFRCSSIVKREEAGSLESRVENADRWGGVGGC